jgi:hypothetical protein
VTPPYPHPPARPNMLIPNPSKDHPKGHPPWAHPAPANAPSCAPAAGRGVRVDGVADRCFRGLGRRGRERVAGAGRAVWHVPTGGTQSWSAGGATRGDSPAYLFCITARPGFPAAREFPVGIALRALGAASTSSRRYSAQPRPFSHREPARASHRRTGRVARPGRGALSLKPERGPKCSMTGPCL